MEIHIQVTNATIAEHLPPRPATTGLGAWVECRGVVPGDGLQVVMKEDTGRRRPPPCAASRLGPEHSLPW
jgi:hypothetical protein